MDVYALLDGASVRQLPDYLEDEEAQHASLLPLTSNEPEEVTRAAYLTRVERDSKVAEWLAADGWGRHWGILIACPEGTDFDDLLGHLRELAQVRLPDGRIVYFRFYDPRVWRPFAATCDRAQSQYLFNMPLIYACENDDGSGLMIDQIKNGTVIRQTIALDDFAASQLVPGVTQPA
jgi:hypothetical protein